AVEAGWATSSADPTGGCTDRQSASVKGIADWPTMRVRLRLLRDSRPEMLLRRDAAHARAGGRIHPTPMMTGSCIVCSRSLVTGAWRGSALLRRREIRDATGAARPGRT